MKNLITLLILAFTLQSCGDKTKKATTENSPDSEKPAQTNVVSTEFTSPLRPNEKLELGKVYADTVKFLNFDDNGDNWLFLVKKNKDTIALVKNSDNEYNFVREDEIEIHWKMDSIRYAGDTEILDYREWLVGVRKINPLKLTDKKVKFLWLDSKKYREDLEAEYTYIVLDEKYIKSISEPEKAVLAYIATFIGNECEWDGDANENRSNLKCKILSALGLGYQCSHSHLGFLRQWFRNDKNVLKELENCPTTPNGATIQDTFDEINLEVKGNKILVFFKASGINLREQKSWRWTEKIQFEFKENELIIVQKDVSPTEHDTFEIRGN